MDPANNQSSSTSQPPQQQHHQQQRRDSAFDTEFPNFAGATRFTMPEMTTRHGARPFAAADLGQFSPPFSQFNKFGFAEPDVHRFQNQTSNNRQPPPAGVRIPITVVDGNGAAQTLNNVPLDKVKRGKFGSHGNLPHAGTPPMTAEFIERNGTEAPIRLNIGKGPNRKTSTPANSQPNLQKINAELDNIKSQLEQGQETLDKLKQQQADAANLDQGYLDQLRANIHKRATPPRPEATSTASNSASPAPVRKQQQQAASAPVSSSEEETRPSTSNTPQLPKQLLHASIETYQQQVLEQAIEFESLPVQNLEALDKKELVKVRKQVKQIGEYLIRILTKLDMILSDNQEPHLKISRRVVVKNANFWMERADQMDERIGEALAEKTEE